MSRLDPAEVELDAQARPVRYPDLAADDLQRIGGQPVGALLPDPVGVERRVLADAAAPTWVNIASETSRWLLECEPQTRPWSAHTWDTRTEPCIVQKCGSASGMSTLRSARACRSCRQSVAIMFVAVGTPVARRNSARISRPEKPSSVPHGSSA